MGSRTELYAGEPAVTAVFPEAARQALAHEHGSDPFRTLESEPGRDPYLATTEMRQQGIVANLDRAEDLQMQGGRHIDAQPIRL
jgi:hypothetical protein